MYRTGDLARWTVRRQPGLPSAGPTTRSRSVGSGSSWARSRRLVAGHPEVGQAAVVVREDRPGDQRLVAYVVAPAAVTVDPEELRRHARSGCPSTWCRPRSWCWTPLPLTPNGKVDRRALPEPALGTAPVGSGPGNVGGRRCCAGCSPRSWVPDRGRGGRRFLRPGRASLLATRLVSPGAAGASAWSCRAGVFEDADRGRPCVQRLDPTVTRDAPAAGRCPRAGVGPAVFAQQRLWFLDRLDGPSGAYNIAGCRCGCAGALDADALRARVGRPGRAARDHCVPSSPTLDGGRPAARS